jgi:hypothetical protein
MTSGKKVASRYFEMQAQADYYLSIRCISSNSDLTSILPSISPSSQLRPACKMVRNLPWKDRNPCSPTKDVKELNGNKRRKITPPPQLCVHCRLLDLDESFQQAYDFYKSAREGLVLRRQDLYGEPDGPFYYEDGFLVHCFQDQLITWSDCLLCRFFPAAFALVPPLLPPPLLSQTLPEIILFAVYTLFVLDDNSYFSF